MHCGDLPQVGNLLIQAKDLSSAVTVVQKRPERLVYPSATEKESNHLAGASFHGESLMKKNAFLEGSTYYTKNLVPDNVLKGVPHGYAHHACSQREGLADFQGENDPIHFPQSHVQERVAIPE